MNLPFPAHKRGMISFLLVSLFIGIILIALSNYSNIRSFEYKDAISLENNYYKTQDIKHSIILASKKGAEEGKIIFNIKHKIWEECVCVSCFKEPTNCVIPSYYTCSICGEEPSLEKEIKSRVIEHLVSLDKYYQDDRRYSIRLWCGDAIQGQLSDLGWSIKEDKQAKIYSKTIENCEEYILVYPNIAGGVTIKFQKLSSVIFPIKQYNIIGISMYDPKTDIATVSFIPNTEEFDIYG